MSSPTRIVHIIFRLAIGGMENGVVNLVNRMSPAFEHHIISLTDATDFQERITNKSVQVHTLNKKPGKDFGNYWRLFKLLRSLRPDLVHTRNFGTVDCGLIARLAGVPALIHSEHGWGVDDLRGGNIKYQRLRRWMSHLAKRCLAVSKDIERWLGEEVGVAQSKLVQIYNGVDTERFKPAATTPSDVLRVGFVGRLDAVKNPQSLLRAVKLCRSASSARPIHAVLVGDGALREELETMVRQEALADSVSFLGAQDDVPEQMRSFDVFVLPSFNEGISNTILEAMASGLPVIAARVGGNVELIDDQVTGALYNSDSADELATILLDYALDDEKRKKHGEQARQRVLDKFSLSTMVAAYELLYTTSINSKG